MTNSKTGLDYYSTDTDRYQDLRIKRLKKNMGGVGIAIYDYILCEIYRVKGCFIEWNDAPAFDIAEYFNIEESLVNEIVGCCCNIGLFDEKLLTEKGVLSSKSIQKRYLEMCARAKRKSAKVPEEYRIIPEESLKVPEDEKLLTEKGVLSSKSIQKNVCESQAQKRQSSGRISNYSGRITQSSGKTAQNSGSLPQSKVKESKVKKKEGLSNDNPKKKTFSVFWDAYHTITGMSKTDKEAAEKYWAKLTAAEQAKATENIQPYFNSLSDSKYCKKSRTYLRDKNFNDEFKNATGVPAGHISSPDTPEIRLGYDERIEGGRRTYATGKYEIPMNAPPRPSSQYCWDQASGSWIIL